MLRRMRDGAVVRGEPWMLRGRRFTPVARVRRMVRRFGGEPQGAGAFAFVDVTPLGVEEETAEGTRLVATPDVTGQACGAWPSDYWRRSWGRWRWGSCSIAVCSVQRSAFSVQPNGGPMH